MALCGIPTLYRCLPFCTLKINLLFKKKYYIFVTKNTTNTIKTHNVVNFNIVSVSPAGKSIRRTNIKKLKTFNQMNFKFILLRNVNAPTRGTSKAAGIDFYVPNDVENLTLLPNEDIVINSGVKVKIPEGYALIAFNKSSIASGLKLIAGACVVDEDYQGEIKLHLMNVGQSQIEIQAGAKILQFVLVPILYPKITEVFTNAELYGGALTERGEGFGTTP